MNDPLGIEWGKDCGVRFEVFGIATGRPFFYAATTKPPSYLVTETTYMCKKSDLSSGHNAQLCSNKKQSAT
jgi:hypothetical protein